MWNRFLSVSKVYFLALLLVFLVTGCSSEVMEENSVTGAPEEGIVLGISEESLLLEEHAVYMAILQHEFQSAILGKIKIVDSALELEDPLFWGSDASSDWLTDEFSSVSPETVDAFLTAGKHSHALTMPFDVKFEHVFVSREDGSDFFQDCEAPDALVVFSRVGFNRDLDQALVYVEIKGCGEWGGGLFKFLEKSDGKWVKREDVQIWES